MGKKRQSSSDFRQIHYTFVPPFILKAIARNGTQEQKNGAKESLLIDQDFRRQRSEQNSRRNRAMPRSTLVQNKRRVIFTANNTTTLPGTIVRSEGDPAVTDISVNEAYDGFGITFDFFSQIFQRNSIDDNGLDLLGTVHYRQNYNNAFWNGSQMVFGDGDGQTFLRFTKNIDVIAHELTHGITQNEADLNYKNQSGALNESLSDVFGSMVKQFSLNQTVDQADWLIGAGIFGPSINGIALRSMKNPGSAFDDPVIGKDPQPDHMDRFVNTSSDNGGVHINSGIPNKAFYLTAIRLGGHAWDVAGRIWYQTLRDQRLSNEATFKDFARLTLDHAIGLFGADVRAVVRQAWLDVGVNVRPLPDSIVNAQGRVVFLRAHDVGTGWGAVPENLDAEVIFKLDTLPSIALGFQARKNINAVTHLQMLDTLRSAFERNSRISVDYFTTSFETGFAFRIQVS
jgi:Zn-dependent metalloprotease